jgi:hypothetical protein
VFVFLVDIVAERVTRVWAAHVRMPDHRPNDQPRVYTLIYGEVALVVFTVLIRRDLGQAAKRRDELARSAGPLR